MKPVEKSPGISPQERPVFRGQRHATDPPKTTGSKGWTAGSPHRFPPAPRPEAARRVPPRETAAGFQPRVASEAPRKKKNGSFDFAFFKRAKNPIGFLFSLFFILSWGRPGRMKQRLGRGLQPGGLQRAASRPGDTFGGRDRKGLVGKSEIFRRPPRQGRFASPGDLKPSSPQLRGRGTGPHRPP